MSDRRSFFKSIAGLFTVAAVNPLQALDPSFYSQRRDADLLMVTEFPINTQMRMLTEMMHGKIAKRITWPTEIVSAAKMCAEVPLQYGIDMTIDPEMIRTLSDSDIEKRFVDPAAHCLAEEIERVKPRRFGLLALPGGLDGGVRVEGGGLALRGLRGFSMGETWEDDDGVMHMTEPHWITSFDMLFG